MKIYYFNDEALPVTLQINHQVRPVPHNPYGEPKIEYVTLDTQEGRLFEIDAPEGAIPWVKRWEKRFVLLSFLSVEAQGQLPQPSDR